MQTFSDWYADLDDGAVEQVNAAVEMFQEHGPALRRPLVGAIENSRHRNMKCRWGTDPGWGQTPAMDPGDGPRR